MLNVNWEQFLGRHDLVWDEMPAKWYDSAFTGNGMLGMIIYKDGAQSIRIDVGRGDVEDTRKMVDAWHSRPRLRIGYFTLDTVGEIKDSQARLDLWNAEARGSVETTMGKIEWRALTHGIEMLNIFEIKATGEEDGAKFTWHPLEAISPALAQARRAVAAGSKDGLWVNWAKTEYPPAPAWIMEKQGDMESCRQPLLDGGEYTTAWRIVDKGNGNRLLYSSIAYRSSGIGSKQEAYDAVQTGIKVNPSHLVDSHRAWWHAYYPESFVTIPDKRWEGFYWIQMYKLASATRADRMLIDNQGPWMQDTTWANAWFNLNVQLTYSCVPDSNRYDVGASLYNKLDKHAQQLVDNMPADQKDGAGLYTIATQQLVAPYAIQSIGDLPWALHDYYMYYRRTLDDKRLREHFFPLLERAMNTYYHVLQEGPDGRLHLPETFSPEYGMAPDCNYNLAMIRWSCQTLLDICNRLKINDPQLPKWKDTLARLADFPVDENGFMIGAGVPFAKGHRHYSHLLLAYPLYLVNVDQPGKAEIIRTTLEHWLGFPDNTKTGYTWTGASSIASAIGDGNKALEYMNRFEPYMLRNTMYKESAESNPVVETPFSGAQSLHNMLLQSWGGTIRVFPAVADGWKDAAFHDLRAEGAFLVSAARKDGRTEFVRIKSLAGEPCRVKAAWDGSIKVKGVKPGSMKDCGGGIVELGLKKGDEAILWSANREPNQIITPVDGDANWNYWGTPKDKGHAKNAGAQMKTF